MEIKNVQTRLLPFAKVSLIVLLVGFYSFLLFYRLGTHAFVDWDEAIYGQVAREAVTNHHWLSLTFFEHNWFEKPPLGIWSIAASFKFFGMTELAGRLPAAFSGLAIFILIMVWAWEFRRRFQDVVLAATVSLFSFQLLTTHYFVNFDSLVSFFILLSLYSFWKGTRGSPRWFLLTGLAIGLGVLTKNVVGLLPLVPMSLHILFAKQFSLLKTRMFWLGMALAAIIVIPWHVYMSLKWGQAFWTNYFLYHVLRRFSQPIESNGAPFLMYFNLLFRTYVFSGILYAIGIAYGLWKAGREKNWRLIWFSFAVPFLVMSLSSTKLNFYITPALPFMVLLSALSLGDLLDMVRFRWFRFLIIAVLLLTAAVSVYSFNSYKLAKGEFENEYADNREVGLFLKNKDPQKPILISTQIHDFFALGYYAGRPVQSVNVDQAVLGSDDRIKPILHTSTKQVFELGNVYLVSP